MLLGLRPGDRAPVALNSTWRAEGLRAGTDRLDAMTGLPIVRSRTVSPGVRALARELADGSNLDAGEPAEVGAYAHAGRQQ